jgi:hypothetical protein
MGRLFVYCWKEKTMNQIRIPQGMRDLISEECEKKEALKTRIEKVFASYGYRPLKDAGDRISRNICQWLWGYGR